MDDGSEALAPGAALRLLLEVQEQDLLLDQLGYRQRELPGRAALRELDGQLSSLAARRAAITGDFEALSTRQAEIEAQVSSFDERIAAIESRLRQGGDYRDVQHMSDEVGSLTRHRSELEDAELEVMERLEPLEIELREIASSIGSIEEQRARVGAEIAEAEREIEAERSAVRAKRAELAAGLPEPLETSYERLREHLGGIGVARLVDGTCSGCHLKLPTGERERVLHGAPGEIAHCDQCGRILVP